MQFIIMLPVWMPQVHVEMEMLGLSMSALQPGFVYFHSF